MRHGVDRLKQSLRDGGVISTRAQDLRITDRVDGVPATGSSRCDRELMVMEYSLSHIAGTRQAELQASDVQSRIN